MQISKILSIVLAVAYIIISDCANAAPITNIRTSISPARVRLVLDSSDVIKYKVDKDGLDFTIEFPDSIANKQQIKLNDSVIKNIKLSDSGNHKSKLTMNLTSDCQYKIYQLTNPNRLVIDIFRINIIKQSKDLAKGVTYTYLQDELNGRQIQAYLVSIAPNAPYELRPFSGAGTYNGRGKISLQATQQNMLAAINASYFDTDGWVIGTIKNNGLMMAADGQPRSGYVIQNGKSLIAQDIAYSGDLELPRGNKLIIKGMNRVRLTDDLVVYNSFYAPTTKTNNFGREVKIKDDRVIAISTNGNMTIEPGTKVLSGHGVNAAALAQLRIGDKVLLHENVGNNIDTAETLISGGPLLLENGHVNVRTAQENIAADIARGRAPRTALGIKRDGTVLLLVIDGRNPNSSGVTLPELAQYFLRLGAFDAVNFDGGGSSVMTINGQIVNHPSDGKERLVSIGLGLFTKW